MVVEDGRETMMTINNKSSQLANDFVELICSSNSPNMKSSMEQSSNDETSGGGEVSQVIVVRDTNNLDLDVDLIDLSKIGTNPTILGMNQHADDLPPKADSCHVSPK